MPKRSIPSLEAYDDDTYRLIHLTPDEKDLNEYLYPPKVGQARPSKGARTRAFSVSNIFSSPPNAPKDQRQYDLAPGDRMPNNLADVAGAGLLPMAFREATPVPDHVNVVLTPAHGLGPAVLGPGYEPFVLSTVDPQTHRPQYSDALITKALESIATHNKAVTWLCDTLVAQWEAALFYYHHASAVEQSWHFDPRTPLYLDPTLWGQPLLDRVPDLLFLTELYQHGQTHHLLLVTARHELSYLYHKVERWRKLPLLQRPASCLSPWDVGLLTARSRSVPRWINREVLGEVHGDHAFVTELDYLHASDLAERYHRIGLWARELQLVVLEVGICPEPGCAKPIRMTLRGGTTRGGRNSLYCDEHTRSRKVPR
jgi:hypothetical protein